MTSLRRKVKIVKTLVTTLEEKTNKQNNILKTLVKKMRGGSIQKSPNIKENKSEKLQPAGADSAKLKKVITNILPVLPDLPSPKEENQLSSTFCLWIDVLLITKALSSSKEDKEVGLTEFRMNFKRQVYSCVRVSLSLPPNKYELKIEIKLDKMDKET